MNFIKYEIFIPKKPWLLLLLFSYKSCPSLCDPTDCSIPSFSISLLPRVCSDSCPLNRWCHQTISSSAIPSPFTFNLLSIRVFSNESALDIRWPKYWSFSFSISPSNAYSGMISFRIDWFDLAVQGTRKSLLQHHNSKASILRHSAFFMVQLSYTHMTTGKIIALTMQTFVGKMMSLLFNVLSRLVKTFLPRSKRLLISWLQSPCAVILEPKKK